MKRSSFLKSLLGIPLIGVVVKEISAKELVSSENVIAQSNSGGHIPNWRNTSNPPMTQSMYGVIHNYQSDGRGNYRWIASSDDVLRQAKKTGILMYSSDENKS